MGHYLYRYVILFVCYVSLWLCNILLFNVNSQAKTRVKLNFLDNLYKFWDMQVLSVYMYMYVAGVCITLIPSLPPSFRVYPLRYQLLEDYL